MNGLAPRCRLIFSKICIRPKGWSADPKQGTWAGLKTMSISLVYISKINISSFWSIHFQEQPIFRISAHIWGLEICMRHKGWSDNSTQSYLPFVSRVKIDRYQIGRIWWHMIRLLSWDAKWCPGHILVPRYLFTSIHHASDGCPWAWH